MNNLELVAKLKDIANNYKTLYVMGCFGSPLNAANKKRYTSNHSYNKKADRTAMINKATDDTFGFDCVCLIKGVLWGWNGDKTKTYGGATYTANGVPDIDADVMISKCSGVSTDFSKIEIGEAVWLKGHIGIYIGDGLAVECTPSWKNNVQITAVQNIGAKSGYNARKWTKHGKLPYIQYISQPTPKPSVATPVTNKVKEWQTAAIADGYKFPKYGADGQWGAECASVAQKAICKKYAIGYKNQNLTKIVQKAVGVTVDGKFGNGTKNAVINFQKLVGLVPDGCVGLNTWKKILGVK